MAIVIDADVVQCVDRCRSMLARLQGAGYRDGDPCCPVCNHYSQRPLGHFPDCPLVRLIAECDDILNHTQA